MANPRRQEKAPAPPAREGRRRPRLRIAYLIVLACMGLFAYKFLEKTHSVQGLAAQVSALRAQNQQLAAQNAYIRRVLPYYQSNDYVVQAARGLLGYSLPGDILIQTNPVLERPAPVHHAPPPPPAPDKPVWQQWWDDFFG